MNVPRQVALVLDGPPTPAWQARALSALETHEDLEVIDIRLTGRVGRTLTERLRDAFEQHVFLLDTDPLRGVQVRPRSDSESGAELVVWLSERPPPESERRELLWLRHGGAAGNLQQAFAAALLACVSSVETEVLLRREDEDVDVLVERTVSGVRPFAETISRTFALWKLAAMVPRAVARVPGRDQPVADAEGRAHPAPPGARLLMRSLASAARAMVTRLLYRRPWAILVRDRGDSPSLGWSSDAGLVRWLDSTYADPFLFEHEGRHHLFCEEVPLGEGRGVISHTELSLDGSPAEPPQCILRAPYHLSYPFVFAHDRQIFMIPETSGARRVELYRARSFPHSWERDTILLEDIDAADATVLEHDGRLWMFVSVAAADASSLDELHLFFSDALRGPWEAHPLNPVVSDIRCARPGGPIQVWGGRLVRPAQDGSRRYGWSLSFREIDVLSTTEYAEHEIDRIEPSQLRGARATHAYTADSRFEAIDVRRKRLRTSTARPRGPAPPPAPRPHAVSGAFQESDEAAGLGL